jgi:cytochrome b561
MLWKNTKDRYGAVTKTFHWVIAIDFGCVMLAGLYLAEFADKKTELHYFPYHKEFGMLVLFLAVPRLLWRLYSPTPDFVSSLKPWERMGANIIHPVLYFCMFFMPLSGWMFSSAAGRPVDFFGYTLPSISDNKDLGHILHEAHQVVGWALFVIVGLHVGGALKHYFIDKDITLQRMLPFGLKDNSGEKQP